MPVVTIDWWPQAKQLTCLEAAGLAHPFTGEEQASAPAARLIGFGGSAGGGKTDALLGGAIVAAITWPGCQIGFFRRTFPELSGPKGAIMRSRELLTGFAHWTGQQHRWTFPNGSVLQFCHCQREQDVYLYQSQQFDILLIDEATHFTRFQVRYLLTRNRATVDGVIPVAILATNPGNVGHLWFKDEFIDIGPAGVAAPVEVEPGEFEPHLFIRSKLADNEILERRDPGYRLTLQRQPAAIRRALLDGDWDVFEGQVFGEWRRDLHVVEPFPLPVEARRWAALDWGYSSPWCPLWFARCAVDLPDYDPDLQRTIVYREAYETQLTDPEQCERIHELEAEDEDVGAYLADPSMWTRKTTGKAAVSTADVYKDNGIRLRPAENDRLTGKRRVHEALALLPDGKPGLLVFSTCRNLIRTLPALPYDPIRVEDVDTDAEDHAYDTLRYGLSYRVPARREPRPGGDQWAAARRGRRRRSGKEIAPYPKKEDNAN